MRPEEPAQDPREYLTRQWLERARHDEVAVDHLARIESLGDIVAFHCQQAAEKSLKAYLTWRDQPFRKVHDLEELTRQCAELDSAFAALLPAAQRLTPYAVE